MGRKGDVQNSVRALNSNLQDYGGEHLKTNKWQSIVLTRNDGGTLGKVYLNGVLNGSSTNTSIVGASISFPAEIGIGAEVIDGDDGGAFTPGYFAFAAVYNREITAAEVLEIHNTLMDGVQQ
jgi:hypothetical protein